MDSQLLTMCYIRICYKSCIVAADIIIIILFKSKLETINVFLNYNNASLQLFFSVITFKNNDKKYKTKIDKYTHRSNKKYT